MAEITAVSPFAPAVPATPPEIDGVAFATAEAGIKYRDRKDLLLVRLAPGSSAAGVLTKSKTCSAPVLWCREQLQHGRASGLVANAGNANAFTGKRGDDAAKLTAEAAARALDAEVNDIYLASTGVIGEPLDASAFQTVLGNMSGRLQSNG
ncbi:MAG: bifunctional ornithine acetyltransferase/N-acetylglutamate synthase, partial [Pseudomonadota bacterium]